MEFFSKIGIDFTLLIAQILNFGLLLLILKKFLYKPIIKRIETDEKELDEAQTKKKELDREREAFMRQKKDEINKARKYNQKIITEADDIAKNIMKSIKEKSNDENLKLIKQLKVQLKSHNVSLKHEEIDQLKEKTLVNLIETVKDIFSKELRQHMQKEYFAKLLSDTASVLSNANNSHAPVVLQCAFTPDSKDIDRLKDLFNTKYGKKNNVVVQVNDGLLSGFALEFGGIFIEKNLIADLKNATK